MSNRTNHRGVVFTCLVMLVAVVLLPVGVARSQQPASKPSDPERRTTKKPVVDAPKKPRMPAHFNAVISPKQREEILAILQDYMPKIDQKRAELKALVEQRDKDVLGVLTAEQQRDLEELRAQARAKRAASIAASRRKREQAEVKVADPEESNP